MTVDYGSAANSPSELRHIHDMQPSDTALPLNVVQAFADLLGDSQVTVKGAARTARLIEEQFLIDGWPVGRLYGGESELAQRYEVGQAMVRETVRILEARGTARMRPGRSASLEVTIPPQEELAGGIGSYCYLSSMSRAQLAVARLIVDRATAYLAAERVASGGMPGTLLAEAGTYDAHAWRRWLIDVAANQAITFYMRCLDGVSAAPLSDGDHVLSAAMSDQLPQYSERLREAIARGDAQDAVAWADACSRHTSTRPTSLDPQPPADRRHEARNNKRAMQIVTDLLNSLGPGQWRDGVFLGNEEELCARYKVDRRCMRQAIRILEAGEAAVTAPGRGHGLIACAPKPAALSRLMCCHFAATNIAHHHVLQSFEWMSIETMAYAARHADATRVAQLAEAIEDSRRSAKPLPPRQQAELEAQQFALADNPVLELFLRSARAFSVWGPIGRSSRLAGMVDDLAHCAGELTDALVARDPVAAARAQARKFSILKSSLDGEDGAAVASCQSGSRRDSVAR